MMTRLCYWCGRYMGKKEGTNGTGVFHSACDECAHRLRLDERLPELLWAIADLRKQNGSKERNQELVTPVIIS